jgi:hypothetical protein
MALEEKNQDSPFMKLRIQDIFKCLFLAYLAILPVADTIALRNLFLFLLLVILFGWLLRTGRHTLAGTSWRQWLPIPLVIWALYLVLFPLWAPEHDVAWTNLRGQWGLSLASWCIGIGAALMLRERGPGLWALSLASAFLVGLHLLQVLLAWSGLFGPNVPGDLPLSKMWHSMRAVLEGQVDWHWQSFPWGFRGFDPMHGNLGYTASQAIALLLAWAAFAVSQRNVTETWRTVLAVIVCFFSIAVANSRGAVLYSAGLIVLAGGLYFWIRRRAVVAGQGASFSSKAIPALLVLFVTVLTLALGQSLRKDTRWHTMVDKARAGFLVEEPVDFLCNGLTPEDQRALEVRIAPHDLAYAYGIVQGLNGDGGRVVLMRASLGLVWEHPLGLDGSRHSFKKLMELRCGHKPFFEFAHTHQAWIDTALALGWGGVLVLATLFAHFAFVGARSLGGDSTRFWGCALFLLAIFWSLRGLADSVYREHNLQMQALLLGYLWGRLQLEMRPSVKRK